MPEHNSPETLQINLAEKQEIVGTIINTKYSLFAPKPIEQRLANLSSAEEKDALAVDDEDVFLHLFRFDATPEVRKQVIDIKNKYKWNKRQVFWQYLSGHLVITEQEAKIMPKRQMLWLGRVELGVSSFFYVLLMLQIIFYTTPSWKLGLGAVATVVFLGALWILNAMYFAPWYTLERSRAIYSSTN